MSKTVIVKSLRELMTAITEQKRLRGIILNASADLICNNLMCEKVTEPCICKLERVLQHVDTDNIEIMDLSNNNLKDLPPSMHNFTNLKQLNVSGNLLSADNIKTLQTSNPNLEEFIR